MRRVQKTFQIKDLLKIFLSIIILFITPLLTAALFVLPVYLLHQYQFISIATYIGEIVGVLLLMYRRRSSVNFGLTLKCAWSDVFWCVFYIIVRTLTWILLVPIVKIQTDWLLLLEQSAFYLFLNAPGEELHFRGLLFSSTNTMLSQKMTLRGSMLAAASISAVLFGFLHFFTNPSWMWLLVFTADGLAFCALRIRSNSLFVPLLAHGLVNILTGAVLVSATTVADNVALTYQITLIIIDLVFFLVVLAPSQKQPRVTLTPEQQVILE